MLPSGPTRRLFGFWMGAWTAGMPSPVQPSLARPADRRDRPVWRDPPDPRVVLVGDDQRAVPDRHVGRSVDLCLRGRSAVPAVPADTGSRDGRDDPMAVDLPDRVVIAVRDVQVASEVVGDAPWRVEAREPGRATVPRVRTDAGGWVEQPEWIVRLTAHDRGHNAAPIDPSDHVVQVIADDEAAVGSVGHPDDAREVGVERGTAVAGVAVREPAVAGADDDVDRPARADRIDPCVSAVADEDPSVWPDLDVAHGHRSERPERASGVVADRTAPLPCAAGEDRGDGAARTAAASTTDHPATRRRPIMNRISEPPIPAVI